MATFRIRLLLALALLAILAAMPAAGQQGGMSGDSLRERVGSLETNVQVLEWQLRDAREEVESADSRLDRLSTGDDVGGPAAGLVLFLTGTFCALWAQNTRRNPWLWFFLGFVFHAIALLFLLSKNAEDRRRARAAT